jgi:hypothetical protein
MSEGKTIAPCEQYKPWPNNGNTCGKCGWEKFNHIVASGQDIPHQTMSEVAEFMHQIGVLLPDGSIDREQLEKEMHDYQFLISNTSEVFSHVTGGKVGKPNTMAFEVIALADDLFSERFERDIKEETEDAVATARLEGRRSMLVDCVKAVEESYHPVTGGSCDCVSALNNIKP